MCVACACGDGGGGVSLATRSVSHYHHYHHCASCHHLARVPRLDLIHQRVLLLRPSQTCLWIPLRDCCDLPDVLCGLQHQVSFLSHLLRTWLHLCHVPSRPARGGGTTVLYGCQRSCRETLCGRRNVWRMKVDSLQSWLGRIPLVKTHLKTRCSRVLCVQLWRVVLVVVVARAAEVW